MTKAPQAFRTISEVSDALDVPQHVLRFWEGKFPQIKPMKRGGGRRYYRPDDIELLRGIRTLLYAEGYTIKGVQKVLRDSGARYVCEIGRYGVKRSVRGDGRAGLPALLVNPAPELGSALDDDPWHAETDAAAADDASDEADDTTDADSRDEAISERRAVLQAALDELLALRDMLRAARPKKTDAA